MSTALLVIDVQDSFRLQDSWTQISDPDVVARIRRLVDHARAEGHEVVWVLHADPGSGGPFDPEGGLVTLQPGLEPLPGETVVTKTVHNAFTTTGLGRDLLRHGVDRLRLAGIRIEQCVETTARLASDMGYDVEVVIDATATHPLPLADGSGVLNPREVIDRTAAALAGRFATITTVDRVVAS